MKDQMGDVITLTADTPRYRAGTVLRVLKPGENYEVGTVDRVKAESLVSRHRVAVWGEVPAVPQAKLSKKPKGGGDA